MKKTNDVVHSGNVSQWHPWLDKKHLPKVVVFHSDGKIYDQDGKKIVDVPDLDSLINAVAKGEFYVLTQRILSEKEFHFINELLSSSSVTPYVSRTGGMAAMGVKQGRKTGYLVPGRTWKWDGPMESELVRNLSSLFKVVGFQAATPASLSEKILRSTLPLKPIISRASYALRTDLLSHHVGGRIDRAQKMDNGLYRFYPRAFEYDKNKAYLHHSRHVPSPFKAPVTRCRPTLEDALSYPAGWWECEIVARNCEGVQPIQIEGRSPVEGENFTRWLWSGELQDCLDHGYIAASITRGYGFRDMSNFMERWSDSLWSLYAQSMGNDHIQTMVKAMMVGLPGRFLRSPERYELLHYTEAHKGDIPLKIEWLEGSDRVLSDWVVHPVPDPESTALTQVGSYIVAEMRREIYHLAKREEARNNRMLRSYIDCVAFEQEATTIDLGTGLGQYKEKQFINVYLEENRFVGAQLDPYGWPEEPVMRAPGYVFEQRMALWRKYHAQTNF